jgi:hypothetical protein
MAAALTQDGRAISRVEGYDMITGGALCAAGDLPARTD